MTNSQLILLLVIIVVVYLLLEKKDYPVPPVVNSVPKPIKGVQSPRTRPKVNLAEDDPIITSPDISYHPARIQTLIHLMWIDLRSLIRFKNKVDYYDSERWYKKEDLFNALSFTTYHEFNNFIQRWKGEFDYWKEWEKYLEEWKSLGGDNERLLLY